MLLFIAVVFIFTNCNMNENEKITWISTTDAERWASKNLSDEILTPDLSVEIEPAVVQQKIDGFGGCFNELGYDALQMLTGAEQDSILEGLFTPEGLNFTICRMPIGANDYARSWYSLNDTPGDYAMEHFNIDRDLTTLIPYIKSAMEYNPDLQVWGSPWCPPAWMKTNNHYACRPAEVNDLPESGAGMEGVTQFIMDEKTLSAYAGYFVKYVKAYRELGINVYAVHVQNEPNSCQNFPSCVWKASDLNTFIGQYLGPTFEREKIDAEIWYGTIERPYIENIDTVLQDPVSQQYVDGLGFQWAGKKAIPDANEKYPEIKKMQTETECGDGSNDWAAAEYTFSLMKHYFENGTNSYLYWNMILDETGKSQWGWKQNSMISVNSQTSAFVFNPEYYLMKHFSHFVKPGAVKIKTNGDDDHLLAFKNPDGKVVVVINNISKSEKTFKLNIGGVELSANLKGKSLNTFSI